VPKSETIKTIIARNIKTAEDSGYKVFFTADRHNGEESELKQNGGPFPLHCFLWTFGQELISEIKHSHSFLHNNYPIFDKRCYDVFDAKEGNPYIQRWLHHNLIDNVLLCGLVGNICVQAAALGLRKLNIATTIIENATVWMTISDTNNEKTSRELLVANGVKFVKEFKI
jgi:nicotinamidase/pyrazinamidase